MGAQMLLTFPIQALNAPSGGTQRLNPLVLFLETADRPVAAQIQLMSHLCFQ